MFSRRSPVSSSIYASDIVSAVSAIEMVYVDARLGLLHGRPHAWRTYNIEHVLSDAVRLCFSSERLCTASSLSLSIRPRRISAGDDATDRGERVGSVTRRELVTKIDASTNNPGGGRLAEWTTRVGLAGPALLSPRAMFHILRTPIVDEKTAHLLPGSVHNTPAPPARAHSTLCVYCSLDWCDPISVRAIWAISITSRHSILHYRATPVSLALNSHRSS